MKYKNLTRGGIELIKKVPLKLDLQTCLGTILYGDKIVGAAHGLIPDGIGSNYPNPLFITPKGIEHLASLIRPNEKEINAILFGGKIEPSKIGVQNAQQAREILERLKIPIKIDFTKDTYWDTNLMVYPDRFEVKSPGFKSVLSRKFLGL